MNVVVSDHTVRNSELSEGMGIKSRILWRTYDTVLNQNQAVIARDRRNLFVSPAIEGAVRLWVCKMRRLSVQNWPLALSKPRWMYTMYSRSPACAVTSFGSLQSSSSHKRLASAMNR
jgi:hypothetical protein